MITARIIAQIEDERENQAAGFGLRASAKTSAIDGSPEACSLTPEAR
jgi:hypothetical protein